MKGHRKVDPHKMKVIHTDVDKVVAHLKAKLGATWAQASAPRAHGHSVLVNPPRSVRPWVQRTAMLAENNGQKFDAWVRSHLDSKVTWM